MALNAGKAGVAFLACLLVASCSDKKRRSTADEDEPHASSAAQRSGDLESMAELVATARAEAEKLWPSAKLEGIRVSEEVPPGARRNIYSVRVSFVFDADPTDPEARSGSIVCSPSCQAIRHKVKSDAIEWPKCSLLDAYKAARAAGLTSTRPVALYGHWGGGGNWSFQEAPDSPSPVMVDASTCAAKR